MGADLRDVRIILVYIDRMLHNKIEYIRKQLLKNVHRVFIMERLRRSKILFLFFSLRHEIEISIWRRIQEFNTSILPSSTIETNEIQNDEPRYTCSVITMRAFEYMRVNRMCIIWHFSYGVCLVAQSAGSAVWCQDRGGFSYGK